jgi:hypothetical protein
LRNKKDKEFKQILVEFKNQLQEVLKDPYEQAASEYFDFIAWLDAKIENKTFQEMIKLKQI